MTRLVTRLRSCRRSNKAGLAALIIAIAVGPAALSSSDALTECLDAFGKLRSALEESTRIGTAAQDARSRATTIREDADRACRYSDTADDRCRARRDEARKADSEARDLESAFKPRYITVDARMEGVQYACAAAGEHRPVPGVRRQNVAACHMFLSYRDTVTGVISMLNESCRTLGLSEDECRICLAENYRSR